MDLFKKAEIVLWSRGHDGIGESQEAADVISNIDPYKDLILSCDASPYVVGALVSHRFDDGTKHLVAYTSRALAPAKW